MKLQFTWWREPDGLYLGFLNEYPEHWTQGTDLAELREQLRDLYREFSRGDLPGIRKVEELEVG